MNLLLDTHIFLWLITDAPQLTQPMRDALDAPENIAYLSVVSVWECLIKHAKGQLPLPEPPEVLLPRERAMRGIETLAIDEPAVCRLAQLPGIHQDPFDRMLVCQALERDLALMTVDAHIQAYPVKLWQPP